MSGNTSHGNYGRLCQIVDLCEAVAIFCIVGVDHNFFVLFFELVVAVSVFISVGISSQVLVMTNLNVCLP